MAGRPKKKATEEVVEVAEEVASTTKKKVVEKTEKKADPCGDCKHKSKYGSNVCKTCVLYKENK